MPAMKAKDGRPTRAWLAAAAGIFLALSLGACGDSDDDAGTTSVGPPNSDRIASVRIYQGGRWTLKGETANSVGAALAKLKPTYVSALVRFQAGEPVANYEVKAWNKVRAAVKKVSPDAKFSIELNALEYPTPAKLTAMMDKVRSRFDNEAWLFDFYTTAAKSRPEVMEAAIADAHEHGELLGGNAFGLAKKPTVPTGTDYIAVQDTAFKIDLDDVKKLAERVPVFFHLGNNPDLLKSTGCAWIREFTTKRRSKYVTQRAGQQDDYNFRFAYPVFFPECSVDPADPNARIYAYNAVKNDPVLETISELMSKYE